MLKPFLLSASLLTLFAGCGGQPDTLWQVNALMMDAPASCYVGGKLPTKTTTETGIQSDVGPWEMYDGPDSKVYLILADKKTVIEGTKVESYSFPWTITVNDTQMVPTNVTRTDSTANTVSFKISSDTLSGTWEVKDTHTCTGTACMNTLPNCTVTHQLKGHRLDISRYRVY